MSGLSGIIPVVIGSLALTIMAILGISCTLVSHLREAYLALDECKDIMRMQRESIESSDKLIAQLEEYIEILEEAEKYD